ncbi:MAG: 6-phosphogluconolactonase [Pacificimonas sp.]
MDIEELELWEAENADEFSASVAGDIGFIIDQALEARREAIIALPVEDFLLPAYALLAEGRRDWRHVRILPSHDGVVAIDDPDSKVATLARLFMPKGARVTPLSSGGGDYKMAGAASDASLQDIGWPLDLVLLTMGEGGGIAGLVTGPDIDEAMTADDDRRAMGMISDEGAEYVTLTKRAITTSRTLMFAVAGSRKQSDLQAAAKGDDTPAGRILADVTVPVDAHVLLD